MYSQEDADRMCRERQQYLELIHENIEYPYLLNEYRKEELDELVELMVDTICSQRSIIRIAGDDKPKEVVKSRFLKLDSGHTSARCQMNFTHRYIPFLIRFSLCLL